MTFVITIVLIARSHCPFVRDENKDENKAEDQEVPSEDDDEDLFSFGYSDDDMPAKLEPKSEGSDDGEGIDIKEEDSEDAY
ncbi:hypothetical protein NW769_010195 [Fusarium oxysporum]|nr:hypothetical protein NW769_010195 [Fusarium oxysporum]